MEQCAFTFHTCPYLHCALLSEPASVFAHPECHACALCCSVVAKPVERPCFWLLVRASLLPQHEQQHQLHCAAQDPAHLEHVPARTQDDQSAQDVPGEQ
eukprot:1161580-Pelagomonas_calceolata.AAC.2